jgi:hypothetical protein
LGEFSAIGRLFTYFTEVAQFFWLLFPETKVMFVSILTIFANSSGHPVFVGNGYFMGGAHFSELPVRLISDEGLFGDPRPEMGLDRASGLGDDVIGLVGCRPPCDVIS